MALVVARAPERRPAYDVLIGPPTGCCSPSWPRPPRRSRDATANRALLLIDLDGFQQVNDTLGRMVGDELLLEVGKRVSESVRSADTVARPGGDEFAVLLGGRQDLAAADAVADKIRSALSRTFVLTAGPWSLGASVGTAVIDGGDIAAALRAAVRRQARRRS